MLVVISGLVLATLRIWFRISSASALVPSTMTLRISALNASRCSLVVFDNTLEFTFSLIEANKSAVSRFLNSPI